MNIEAGTLVLFYGRNYLHRVTPVTSSIPRILATLNYNHEKNLELAENARLTFLLISSWHFGSDWAISRNDILAPILIGLCILIFPSMLHQNLVTKVFSYLVIYDNANKLVVVMRQLAFMLVPAGIFFCYHSLKNEGIAKGFECMEFYLFTH